MQLTPLSTHWAPRKKNKKKGYNLFRTRCIKDSVPNDSIHSLTSICSKLFDQNDRTVRCSTLLQGTEFALGLFVLLIECGVYRENCAPCNVIEWEGDCVWNVMTHAKKPDFGPIHTTRHVSVPSPFPLHSVRLICVHTACRVQSPSGIARDTRPALISINYAASFAF